MYTRAGNTVQSHFIRILFPLLYSPRSPGGMIAEGGDSSAPILPVRGAADSYSRLTLGVGRTGLGASMPLLRVLSSVGLVSG